jgi:chemotaxis protein histidine kinase CheA
MFEAGNFPAKVWPVSGLYELEEEAGADSSTSLKHVEDLSIVRSELKMTEEQREASKAMLAEELSKYELKTRAEAEEPEEVTEEVTEPQEAANETAEEPQAEEIAEEPSEEVQAEEPQTEEIQPEEAAEPQEAAEETSEEPQNEEVTEETQPEEAAEEAVQEETADGSLNAISGVMKNTARLNEAQADILSEETEEEETVETAYVELTESVKSTNGVIAVEYDPEALTFVGAEPALGCTSVYNDEEYGVVYFAYANETAVKAESVLASLNFTIPCEDTALAAYTLERNNWLGITEKNDDYTFAGKGHNFVEEVTKATLTEDGLVVTRCSDCGKVESEEVIPHPVKFKLAATSYIYDGKVKNPAVTITDEDGNVIDDSNYTVTYASGCKNIGTYKATVKMKGYYSGTKTLSFKIRGSLGRKVTQVTVAKIADKTYTGSKLSPAVSVKAIGTGGKVVALKEGTDYTVTYGTNTAVGIGKITIKGKGNYVGTKNVTFKIVPKGTTLSSLTAASKGFTAKWNKQSEKMPTAYVTGYELQYSTSSSFTAGTTSSVKAIKYSTVSQRVLDLSANKKYYVRIRTFKTTNDKTYYSAWSKVMTVTTKA